jgi:hypothetical protein
MGEMSVMGRAGDTRLSWDPTDTKSVEEARGMFDELMKTKRYLAFSINPADDSKGVQITAFDPVATKIIISPALAGGR